MKKKIEEFKKLLISIDTNEWRLITNKSIYTKIFSDRIEICEYSKDDNLDFWIEYEFDKLRSVTLLPDKETFVCIFDGDGLFYEDDSTLEIQFAKIKSFNGTIFDNYKYLNF